jgi:hypothetical protein
MTSISGQLRLGGVAEVAAELGVSRQQVANLREREDFPAPVASPSVGDIWDLDAVGRWNTSGRRRAAGRPAAKRPPRVLGRKYELGDEIGSGGFALVHTARDVTVDDGDAEDTAAIKLLKPERRGKRMWVTRFKREMEIVAELRSRWVIPVLDSGTDDELGPWYAMPLAQRTLEDEIGTVTEAGDIAQIMREICGSLTYIHGEGILHRDLKPANVLRHRRRWKVADFGLARDTAEQEPRFTSTVDAALGSRYYTAPEQFEDMRNADERSDVFSAGKILQALVTGTKPITDELPAGRFKYVIGRAIARNPRERYPSAEALLEAVEDAVAVPELQKPWEPPIEKAARVRALLEGEDTTGLADIIEWAQEIDANDADELKWFAWTLSAMPADSIRRWSKQDPSSFKDAFQLYAMALKKVSFGFERCDTLANFAHRVVTTVKDTDVLREAVSGLATLGHDHNRWHVRDVAVRLLQRVRTHEDACSALDGLREAGAEAVDWTLGSATTHTLNPTLRSGIQRLLTADSSVNR